MDESMSSQVCVGAWVRLSRNPSEQQGREKEGRNTMGKSKVAAVLQSQTLW